MGRKLDLGELTEEEEKVILDVIKKDYTLRKVESKRIGKLSKDVEVEEQKQKEIVKEAVQGEVPIDSLCAKCGSKFIWLINPKSQCKGCDLYFCKNKISCIVYDKLTEKCFCNACLKQRDLHSFAGDWFYTKLKGKFRRHGGAKVSRELQKRKKDNRPESESSPPPPKPRRLNETKQGSPSSSISSTPMSLRRLPSDSSQSGVSRSSIEEVKERIEAQEIKIQEEYNAQMDAVVIETGHQSAPPLHSTSDIEIQTDDLENFDDSRLTAIKEELESAISKILLPKLDELKRSQIEHQTEVDRQQKVEDAVQLAEEMIDKAMERAREKHNQRPAEENILLTKYLSDSKTELMDKFTNQLHDESSFQQTSARSSLRETGTMTETSDSEMESLSSASGRKRSPKDLPLSERLGSLSPDSLRKTLNHSQNSSSMGSITQGVVLQKDQLVARADIDNALGQILDEHGVTVHGSTSPQEFSTELKFTAVGGGRRRFPSGEISDEEDSNQDDDEEESAQKLLTNSENWSTPELQRRPAHFGTAGNSNSSNSMMSIQNHVKSPYENLGGEDSDSDDREHVHEEQVLASVVRRPDGVVSPQALVSPRVDVVENIATEKKPRLPVDVAVDPKVLESISVDLNKKTHQHKTKNSIPDSPPVTEELILAIDREMVESGGPLQEEAETLYHDQDRTPTKPDERNSSDSAYCTDYRMLSPDTPSSESELSAIPEASQEERYGQDSHSESESSESGTSSSNASSRMNRNSYLQPQRHTLTQEQKIPASQLSYDDDLIADRDDFGDRIAEMLAQKQRESYEPKQEEVTIESSIIVRESISSISDDEISKKEGKDESSSSSSSSSDSENSPTPKAEEHRPGVEESAIGIRMVNGKSLEVLTDALERIGDAKKSLDGSDSKSSSSKTCSIHGSVEDIHKMNEAEEAVYRNAAETFMMEEKLDQLEHVATGLNQSDPGLRRILDDIDAEVDMAEKQVEQIKHEGKSIDAIMQELRGAGLQVERGGFKRTSLDSAPMRKKDEKPVTNRYSLPPVLKPQRPVNAADRDRPSWLRNTFTVVPGSRSVAPIDSPISHSTPKQPDSSSSSSSSSGSSTPTRSRSPVRPRILRRVTSHEEKAGEQNELQATIASILKGTRHSEARAPSTPPHSRENSFEKELNFNANNANPLRQQAILPASIKSASTSSNTSDSSRTSSHSAEYSVNDDDILQTAKKHFSHEEATLPASLNSPSSHSSHSSHSSTHPAEEITSTNVVEIEATLPASLKSSSSHSSDSSHSSTHHQQDLPGFGVTLPSSLKSPSSHSSRSSHSSFHPKEEEINLRNAIEIEATLPAALKSPSSHSSHSSHSQSTDDEQLVKNLPEIEGVFPASLRSPSSHSSHSSHSSVHSPKLPEVGVTLPASLKSPSSHSSNSSHSSKHSVHEELDFKAEIEATLPSSLRSPSSHSSTSSHSSKHSVHELKTKIEATLPASLKSPSSHSSDSSHSLELPVQGELDLKTEIEATLPASLKSPSSHSSDSSHSSRHSVHEELNASTGIGAILPAALKSPSHSSISSHSSTQSVHGELDLKTEIEAILPASLKSPSSHSSTSSHSSKHSMHQELDFKTEIAAILPAALKSPSHSSISSHSSTHSVHGELNLKTEIEATLPASLKSPSTHSSTSSHSSKESVHKDLDLQAKIEATLPASLKSSSSHSSDSSDSSKHSVRDLKTRFEATLPAALKSPSSHSSVSSHSSKHSVHEEFNLKTEIEAILPAPLKSPSSHSSDSSHSSKHSAREELDFKTEIEATLPASLKSPSSHSSVSSHSSEHSVHEKLDLKAEIEATLPASLKSPSSHSSHSSSSSHSSKHSVHDLKTRFEANLPVALKSPSSHSSSSSDSSKRSLREDLDLKAEIEATLSVSLKSPSSHSSDSSHSSKRSLHEELNAKTEIEAILPASLKSPSSHSSSSSHSSKRSAHEDLNVKTEIEATIPASLKSPSSHSSNSSHSSHSSHSSRSSHSSIHQALNVDARINLNKNNSNSNLIEVSIIPPIAPISSRSATSIHSSTSHTSSSSVADVQSEDEELSKISYTPGLTAQELEEARVPTPVPRRKKEVLQIEETVILPAPEPRKRKKRDSSDQEETVTVAETLPAKDVRRIVDRIEGRRSSSASSSSDESGAEYTEPLIRLGMKTPENEERKKKLAKRQKLLVHQPISTESEASAKGDDKSGKRRSKILKDDSWMKKRGSNSDSDSASDSCTMRSVGTGRSSRAGLFHNISAAQQREMARIALLHCPETAIADDQYQTKTITVVRTADVKSPPPVQKEVLPAVQVSPAVEVVIKQQEIVPTLAPHDISTVAEVHHERNSSSTSSSSSSSSSGSFKRRSRTGVTSGPRYSNRNGGTSFNTNSEKSKLRHSYDGPAVKIIEKNPDSRNLLQVTDSASDLDRAQGVRGSITMRGGKMVMTSSPDSKPEFQNPSN